MNPFVLVLPAIASGLFGEPESLAIAKRYEGAPYGEAAGKGEFVCSTFIVQVLREMTPIGDNTAGRINIVLADSKPEAVDKLVDADDENIRGIQFALEHAKIGQAVKPEEVRPGDFVQYWYREGAHWAGHSAIVVELLGDKLKIYGAHKSAGKVTEIEVPFDPKSRRAYFARFTGSHPSTLAVARTFEARAYGKNPGKGELDETSFIGEVLQKFPKIDKEALRRLEIVIPSGEAEKLDALVDKKDPQIRGVPSALEKANLGDKIKRDNVRAGDFVQYWVSRGKHWEGHVGIVVRLTEKSLRVYGPQPSLGKVTEVEVPFDPETGHYYFARLAPKSPAPKPDEKKPGSESKEKSPGTPK